MWRRALFLVITGVLLLSASAKTQQDNPLRGRKSRAAYLRALEPPSEGTIDLLQDSLNIRLIGHWPHGPCYTVAVQGGYAYIGSGRDFLVINVSDPSHPRREGVLHLPGIVADITLFGSYAYVADGEAGLRIIDVSDPIRPREIGYWDTPGFALGVGLSDSCAWVADGNAGLRAIDVSDPTSPQEIGSYDTPGYASGVALSDSFAYVADEEGGLRVVEVSDPTAPQELGFYETPDYAEDVTLAGSYAYVADGYAGLRVIDVFDPAYPREVGFWDTPGYAWRVVSCESYLYIADDKSGLRVINVFDPTNPQLAGFYEMPGHALDVAISDSLVYVAAGYAGLYSLEFHRNLPPQAPVLLAPGDNDSLSDSTPTLSWQVPSDPEGEVLHFKVEVDRDGDFSSGAMVFESRISTLGFNPPPPVPQGVGTVSYTLWSPLAEGEWYWRVSAWDGHFYGPPSEVRRFIIHVVFPPVYPTGIAVINNETIHTITWVDAEGFTGETYNIYMSVSPILSITAPRVYRIGTDIPEGQGSYEYQLYTPWEGGRSVTYYYAVTVASEGVENDTIVPGENATTTGEHGTTTWGWAAIWVDGTVFNPPTIDGDLGDWPSYRNVWVYCYPENPENKVTAGEIEDSLDLSFYTAFAADPDNIYLAYIVLDDILENVWSYDDGNVWRGDATELYLGVYDMRPSEERHADYQLAPECDFQIEIKANAGTGPAFHIFTNGKADPSDTGILGTTQWTGWKVEGYYWVVEAKLPLEALYYDPVGHGTPPDLKVGWVMPANLMVNDGDTPGEGVRDGQLSWSNHEEAGSSWDRPDVWKHQVVIYDPKQLPRPCSNLAPQAPGLSSPAPDSYLGDTTPTLVWRVPLDPDGDALHFKVELARDSGFTSELRVYESRTNTVGFSPTPPVPQGTGTVSYTLQSPLAEGIWYWRVSAWDGQGYGPVSEVWKFTIQVTPSTYPTDIMVINNDKVHTIRWTDATAFNGETYNIYMSESPITDITAPGVYRIGTDIPEGVSSYEYKLYTPGEPGAVTYYYAVTVVSNGVENDTIVPGENATTTGEHGTTTWGLAMVWVDGTVFSPPVAYDGDLSDWPQYGSPYLRVHCYPENPENATSPDKEIIDSLDLSFYTYCSADPHNLYFAFDVTDDVLENVWSYEDGNVWRGDAAEFYLGVYDMRPSEPRHTDYQLAPEPDFNIVMKANAGTGPCFHIYTNEKATPGHTGVTGTEQWCGWVEEGHRWVIEAKLPLNVLFYDPVGHGDPPELKIGWVMPANVMVDDGDTPGEGIRDGVLIWSNHEEAGSSWERPDVWKHQVVIYDPKQVKAVISGLQEPSEEKRKIIPKESRLLQNYPNPFNAQTIIEYQLPHPSHVRLEVYDLLGHRVRRLVDDRREAGTHRVQWDGKDTSGRDVASGVYLCRIQAGDFVSSKKLLLIR